MKQGSITSFWKKKEEKTPEKSDAKTPNKEKSPRNSPKKISTPIKSQTKEKIVESPKSKKSSAKKSAILEDAKSSKKRRHIVDDEDEEWSADKEDEQATDLLVPEKKSKVEKSQSKSHETPSEDKSNIQIESNFKNISIVNKKDSKDGISFDALVQALSKIETTKGEGSKDIMKETLSELFKTIILNSPEDLSRAFYFLLSKVGPEYKAPEFGIGTGILEKVVAKAIGKSDKHIKERMVQLGDLALVASEGKKTLGTMDSFKGFGNTDKQKKELSIKQVMDTFTDLANIKGKSSMAEKEKLLIKLLFSANKDEIKYIVRSLQKGLKIGASFKTINAALARAICKIYNESSKGSPKKSTKKQLDEKEVEKTMLIAINNLSDEDIVLQHVIEVVYARTDFHELINLCKITPGIPVKPQLARPTTGVKVIFERFEGVPFTCEYKYDGFRGQVHHYPIKGGHKTEIFSRNLENMSESYPDIIQYVDSIHSEKVHSFILDCEIVAFDQKTGKILPFHNLTTRARKNVNVKEISTQVCMFLFDVLYFNGKTVCDLTLDERRKLMKDNFEESPNIQLAKYVNSDKIEEIQDFMNESITAGKLKVLLKYFLNYSKIFIFF
jgi:DNA ligase 1